jgi:hypothetical protein
VHGTAPVNESDKEGGLYYCGSRCAVFRCKAAVLRMWIPIRYKRDGVESLVLAPLVRFEAAPDPTAAVEYRVHAMSGNAMQGKVR